MQINAIIAASIMALASTAAAAPSLEARAGTCVRGQVYCGWQLVNGNLGFTYADLDVAARASQVTPTDQTRDGLYACGPNSRLFFQHVCYNTAGVPAVGQCDPPNDGGAQSHCRNGP